MSKVIVLGSINYDFTMKVPRLPNKGESMLAFDSAQGTGGKGSNQAVQAARLGSETYMIGCVGQDFMGDIQLKALAESGIHTEYIRRSAEKPTGTAYIIVAEDGNNMIVVDMGANGTCDDSLFLAADELFVPDNILVIQLEIPIPTILSAMKLARKRGMFVILDPAPLRQVPDEIWALADLVKPNETEAGYHMGIPMNEKDIPGYVKKAADALMSKGAPRVIITLGEKGCYYQDARESFFCGSFPVKAVDATGAGDSFSGALASGIAQGKTMREAITLACAAGGRTASCAGAAVSIPTTAELEQFLSTHQQLKSPWE